MMTGDACLDSRRCGGAAGACLAMTGDRSLSADSSDGTLSALQSVRPAGTETTLYFGGMFEVIVPEVFIP
jgi:hypothetical protein